MTLADMLERIQLIDPEGYATLIEAFKVLADDQLSEIWGREPTGQR